MALTSLFSPSSSSRLSNNITAGTSLKRSTTSRKLSSIVTSQSSLLDHRVTTNRHWQQHLISTGNKRNILSLNRYCYLLTATLLFLQRSCSNNSVRAYSSYYGGATMSKPYNIQRDGSGTITITPKNEADQSALVVICHGLGDTSEGFADVAEHLATQLPYCKIVLPTAPTQPVTMNMGMAMPSWYDIKGLDERSNEDCKGISTSQERIVKILDDEHNNKNLSYSRMIIGGFSQGGALSLYTGLQLPIEKKLAGIFCLSAYLPCARQVKVTDGLQNTPIFHGHGKSDPLVLYQMAVKSQELCTKSLGVTTYQLKAYDGLQHSVNMEEISDVTSYIKGLLPPDDSCKVTLKEPKDMSIKELKAAIRNAGITNLAVGFMEKSEFVKLVEDHRNGKL